MIPVEVLAEVSEYAPAATHLAQLTGAGEIQRGSDGHSTVEPDRLTVCGVTSNQSPSSSSEARPRSPR